MTSFAFWHALCVYGELSDEQLESLHGMQPLGRYDIPKDIADAVLYLANATRVTGVILPVGGGVRWGRSVSRNEKGGERRGVTR